MADSRIAAAADRLRSPRPLTKYQRDGVAVLLLCAARCRADGTLPTHVAQGLAHAVDALNGETPASNGSLPGGDR